MKDWMNISTQSLSPSWHGEITSPGLSHSPSTATCLTLVLTSCRLKDESPQFVLNDRSLFLIAKRMPLDSSALLSCVTPAPPLLRFYANVVVELIQKGLENPQHQPAEL